MCLFNGETPRQVLKADLHLADRARTPVCIPLYLFKDLEKGVMRSDLFQFLMLDEDVSPAADQPGSWAVGQPLVTPCNPLRIV
eukprot:1160574-Pelagomonas_calceolata.AAC.3